MKVRIFQPPKSTMQSGRAQYGPWVLEYERESARVPEPLIGWVASDDTLNQVRLFFKTSEQAVEFAQSKGWTFEIEQTHPRHVRPRNYTDNFRYTPPADDAAK